MEGTIPIPKPTDPRYSPTYPQRTHAQEAAGWSEVLDSWTEKIAAAGRELDQSPGRGDPEARRHLFIQMLGARDQIADCVRRLPSEAGALFEEDVQRIRAAEAALARLERQWRSSGPAPQP